MRNLRPVFSVTAPNTRDALWIKPIDGGFLMYVLDGGVWKPLVLADDNGTASEADDIKQDLIGKSQDSKNKNTIHGAKNYAKDQADALKGTESDTSEDLTLYGLKAYIDAKTT